MNCKSTVHCITHKLSHIYNQKSLPLSRSVIGSSIVIGKGIHVYQVLGLFAIIHPRKGFGEIDAIAIRIFLYCKLCLGYAFIESSITSNLALSH
jgi:hypothetical protein